MISEFGGLPVQGIERFAIKKIVREKPVLVCEVEVLPEDNDSSEEVRGPAGGEDQAGGGGSEQSIILYTARAEPL